MKMDLKKLLSEYELIKGIYLRSDQKAVASFSSDETSLGFLKIQPISKKYFEGRGIVLEGSLSENMLHLGNPLSRPAKDIQGFTQSGSDENMLTITSKHINEFVNSEGNINSKEVHDYLNNFSNFPCKAYAVDTMRNKFRNFMASLSLTYSPLRYKQRKRLQDQIKNQIPDLVDVLIQLLDKLQESLELVVPTEQIKGYEELMDCSLNELIGKSKAELQSLTTKKILKKMKYTDTKNIAKYEIHNVFDIILKELGKFKRLEFRGDFKLNCK